MVRIPSDQVLAAIGYPAGTDLDANPGAAAAFNNYLSQQTPQAPAPAPAAPSATPAAQPSTQAPAPAPAPSSPAANQATQAQRDALAYLRGVLDQYGLASLADWVWDQIIDGRSENEILQSLRDRPEYKTRFKAITEREKRGLPAMSPAEVIAYETAARQLMRAAGLPGGFFDRPDDFVQLIGGDVSVAELSDRVSDGFTRVARADPNIREVFGQWFGAQGNAALASYFLDPQRAAPLLMQQVTAAEFGGVGQLFGFDLSRGRGLEAAALGIGREQAQQGFEQLVAIGGLFDETISEAEDLEAEREGVEAIFGLGGGAESAQRLTRRRQQRTAAFEGGGGAQATRGGVRGLGRAT